MTDLVLSTIATALITWATSTTAEGGRGALSRLLRTVRERFQDQPANQATLTQTFYSPPDPTHVSLLVELLRREVLADPVFADEIRRQWTEVTGSATSNTVSDDVNGQIVQARDIHGGIVFGDTGSR